MEQLVSALMEIAASEVETFRLKIASTISSTIYLDLLHAVYNQDIVQILLVSSNVYVAPVVSFCVNVAVIPDAKFIIKYGHKYNVLLYAYQIFTTLTYN